MIDLALSQETLQEGYVTGWLDIFSGIADFMMIMSICYPFIQHPKLYSHPSFHVSLFLGSIFN